MSDRPSGHELNAAFARCFAGKDGAHLESWLRQVFVERRSADAKDGIALARQAGARDLALQILMMVKDGRNAH